MRGRLYSTLTLSFIFAACSVDYSILEDRYCNSKNECIEGYICDLNTGKCIKLEKGVDVHLYDVVSLDIKPLDTKHYDIKDEINDEVVVEDIYDTNDNISDFDEIKDIADKKDNEETGDYGAEDFVVDGGICESGTSTCKDNDLYKCNENNEFVFEKSCEIGCIKDHCMECLPNERHCADETHLNICNDDGIFSPQECGYKCYSDRCVICLPDDKYCRDKTAITCNPIGTEWLSTDCEIGCSAGECMICTPDVEKKCVDNDVYICSASGMEFQPIMNCCHDNNCSDGACVITAPRVIDYNPKDWKVPSTVDWNITGCFFVANESKVMINYDGSWKEITDYNNFKYQTRTETRIQIKVDVVTGKEYNFKVVNPDGQQSGEYPIKKHY